MKPNTAVSVLLALCLSPGALGQGQQALPYRDRGRITLKRVSTRENITHADIDSKIWKMNTGKVAPRSPDTPAIMRETPSYELPQSKHMEQSAWSVTLTLPSSMEKGGKATLRCTF